MPPISINPGLTAVVDVFDQPELFEYIDNQRVIELSRLGGKPGFSGEDAIRKSTGISTRRILAEGLTSVDLAAALVARLTQVTQLNLDDFDAVLLCHSHTEQSACADLAKDLTCRLGVKSGLIVPFNHGCCGFLKLLHDGVEVLENGVSPLGRVALLSVETPETWHDASDRLFCGIVSAGATASVVERDAGLPISMLRAEDFLIPVDRRPNPNPLFHKEWADGFTFRGEPCHAHVMRMNSEPVFINGIELMLNNLRSAVMTIDRQPGQRVIVVPHQPSGKLLRALVAAARNEFPDFEFVNNLDAYGNTISSSVPTILSRLPEVMAANAMAPIGEGDHVILLAAGICMSEMENHMSAGHGCLQWSQAVLNKPRTVPSSGELLPVR